MSDDARLAALEAVAEAARKWLIVVAGLPYQQQEELDVMDKCETALNALDALPAPQPQPAVETVEVGIYRYGDKPWLRAHLMETDGPPPSLPWALVSRWRGPVPPLPTIPTIAAEVTP